MSQCRTAGDANGRRTACPGDNLLSVGSFCMYNKYELSNVTRFKDNTGVPKFNEGPLAHSRSIENVPIRISLRASALLNEGFSSFDTAPACDEQIDQGTETPPSHGIYRALRMRCICVER